MDHSEIAFGIKIMYNKIANSNRYINFQTHILGILCLQIYKVAHILEHKLILKFCAKIIKNIKEIIFSNDFLNQHRFAPSDFTRERKLSFPTLILFFINLNKRAYRDELDSFFKTLFNLVVDECKVTKAALSIARKKLSYKVFIDLNYHLSALFYQYFHSPTWFGFNILSLDSSTLQLPKTKEIINHFGGWKPRLGDICPMARVSQLFNVMSKTTLDTIISPKNNGERELAHQHFHWINSDDLVLLDRGYAAFWLFKSIVTKQAHFCARICNTQWKPIRKFFHSGAKEKIVTIHPAFYALKKCRELGLDTEPLKLRLVRIDLENGDTEILITSLLNTLIFPQSEFAGLYHLRWSVEEDYKIIKQRLIEN